APPAWPLTAGPKMVYPRGVSDPASNRSDCSWGGGTSRGCPFPLRLFATFEPLGGTMGLLAELSKIRAGYPMGWRKYARGTQGNRMPPFVQPTDPDDRRSQIPALGLREYWYPALPAKDVGWKKPEVLRICGEDLVFFRDKQGEVQALWDYCPHRGAMLSHGDCFWKGYVSCPYHGATFDGNGECVEFITEGPDSQMVGRLKARKYPTRTLKGTVFVWMGDGEPASI